ncbi:YegS/Rv2252/BmrU family lipid kinase|uniref:Lipid kinase, YegS/Rv2252/BmrU family n=1 Tax=Dendrosporobacter quercicolus TaxID=146817 RepID=A0A1G9VZA1_9FIRM|nr:YegS/Rv2252/BmrU family lipid kinase [Dendrosporobacter quercicolus]NSL47760.1 YegS/Rv2252/BmrU family lipid kinase [Dendrosporobacter quercicolus DSM 1736]SDM77584.1 lipid kinase, YegS/Rv2252/BmrU family [Dendrosporobacter quercicolus]
MKKLILVYNPVSGDAFFKYRLDDMIEKFLHHHCVIIPFRTSKDNLVMLASLVGSIAADGVVVAGGDGTVSQVINILLQQNIDLPVGIIPSGTSNDFASHTGLGEDLDRYIAAIAQGAVMPVDVGKINGQYFLNVASAGLLTSVAHSVDSALKNILGKIAYYLKGLGELPHFRSLKMTIRADGRVIEEELFLFLILNSGTVGSIANLIPARIDDGKLDLLIVKQCGIPELMTLLISLLTSKNPAQHRSVIYLQARHIAIECSETVESDVDGELGPNLPLEITAVSGRLNIFCEQKPAG